MDLNSLTNQFRPLRIGPFVIRGLRLLIPILLIGLAVHLLLPQLANLQDAWQTILQMPGWLVILAVAAQNISYGGNGYLLAALAAMVKERLSIVRGTLIILASASIGLVAGGLVGSSVVIYRWTSASGVSKKAAGLCGTLPPLFNNFFLTLISILGLLHLLFIHELTRLQGVSFGLILATLMLVVIGGLWGVTHPAWLFITMTRLGKRWALVWKRPFSTDGIENNVNQFVNTWHIIRNRGWRKPTAGAVVYIVFDMLTLYFLFMAAGHPVSPGVLLTGYGLPLLIGRVSFLPGGVGIVEATMTAIYVSMGVPPHVTVVVTLAYRLISFWIPTLLGFPIALYLQQKTKSLRSLLIK